MNTARTQGNGRRKEVAAALLMLHAFAQRLALRAERTPLSNVLKEAAPRTTLCPPGQLDDSIAEPLLEHSLADGDDGVRGRAVQRLRTQSLPEATPEGSSARAREPIIHWFDPTPPACSNRRNAARGVDGSPISLQVSTPT